MKLLNATTEHSLFVEGTIDDAYKVNALDILKDDQLKSRTQEFKERAELNKGAVLTKRHNHFAITGSTPEDYQEVILDLSGGRQILAGIRFLGLQKSHPFVDIWPNYSLRSIDDLRPISNAVIKYFRVFEPQEIRFLLRSDHPILKFSNRNEEFSVRLGLHTMVGKTSVVANARVTLEPTAPNVHLSRPMDSSYYHWYRDTYEEFHRDHPKMRHLVPINSFEEQEEARAADLLWEIKKGQETIGQISGLDLPFLGCRAVYISDIVLAKQFRGKSLAPYCHSAMARELPNKYALIWGTIDELNRSSLAAASKVGRRPIQSEYFIGFKS